MSYFHPGDVVTVIPSLDGDKKYASQGEIPSCCVTYMMIKLAGKPVTITDIAMNYPKGIVRYHIKEDDGVWVWTDEMFEEYYCDSVEIEPSSDDEVLSFLLSN